MAKAVSDMDMALHYQETPLLYQTELQGSAYIPDSQMMFYIINIMDQTIKRNVYFRRLFPTWHPLISRLYFSVLFYIQTIRAQAAVNHGSAKTIRFLRNFLKIFNLENFLIPGPLVTTFESLAATYPNQSGTGYVTPFIPEIIGTTNNSDLLQQGQAQGQNLLLLPHVPGLIAFIKNIISAAGNNVPDYGIDVTFNNTVDRTLLGHIFTHNAWTQTERNFLLNPALTYKPTVTTAELTEFSNQGSQLDIPNVQANTNTRSIDKFLYLKDDTTWFSKILAIMSIYSKYFEGSETMANISPLGPQNALVITERIKINELNGDNFLQQLNVAFPPRPIYKLSARYVCNETKIPTVNSYIGMFAQTNVIYARNPALGDYDNLGNAEHSRTGPYWDRNPRWQRSLLSHAYKTIEQNVVSITPSDDADLNLNYK